MEENSGISRRDILKRGAVAGTAVLWAVPVVQVIGMSASHAEAASGGGGGTPTSHPTTNPTPTGNNPTTPTGNNPTTNVLPTEIQQAPTPTASVQGISFEQPPPPAVEPTATLPFTGAAVPMTGTVALGAGLVATGVAAVAATRRRQQAGATAGGPSAVSDPSADDAEPPTA